MEKENREALLKEYVRKKISLGFFEVFDQEPFIVYVRSTRRVNHILHLLLSVVSFGLWLPIWVIMALPTKKVIKIWVDEQGDVFESRWR